MGNATTVTVEEDNITSHINNAQTFDELLILANQNAKYYHIHVHFNGYQMRLHAMKIREVLKKWVQEGRVVLDIGPVHDIPGKNGPHTWASFEIQVDDEHLTPIIKYLMYNHGGLAILVHPLAFGEVENHTTRAFWIGTKCPLKFEYLSSVDEEMKLVVQEHFSKGNKLKAYELMMNFIIPNRYGIKDEGACSERIKKHFEDYKNPDTSISDHILAYFFRGNPNEDNYRQRTDLWFSQGEAQAQIDEEIKTLFGEVHAKACEGLLDEWQTTPRSALSLVILLDQFSRHIYRGTPKMFSCDSKASQIALQMINNNVHMDLSPIERHFLYLALEHTEVLELVELGVKLILESVKYSPYAQLPYFETYQNYAKQHLDIMREFGRYPHRNVVLQRETTEKEKVFLETSYSSFFSSVLPAK